MVFRAIAICGEDCSADYTVQNILLIVLFPISPNSAIFALMQINRGEISETKKFFAFYFYMWLFRQHRHQLHSKRAASGCPIQPKTFISCLIQPVQHTVIEGIDTVIYKQYIACSFAGKLINANIQKLVLRRSFSSQIYLQILKSEIRT